MSKLQKFPFKSMISIINYLHANNKSEGIDIYNIMDASNACYPDTSEVVQMLSYLTSFGQVQNTNNGWICTNKQEFTSKILFRERYLNEIILIISNLSDQPTNVSNLNNITENIDKDELEEYLSFLTKITAFGIVKKSSDGWKLVPYNNKPRLETPAD